MTLEIILKNVDVLVTSGLGAGAYLSHYSTTFALMFAIAVGYCICDWKTPKTQSAAQPKYGFQNTGKI